MGGSSDIIIENNMITFNERFSVKLSRNSEKHNLTRIIYSEILPVSNKLTSNNYAFDPKFSSPRFKMDFTVESKLPCCAYGSDNQILGSER